MVQIYQNTKQYDRNITLILVLCFVAPVALAVVAALVFNNNIFGWILWPLTGILVGILVVMIVLGRRAESVAYAQLEGRAGRGWRRNQRRTKTFARQRGAGTHDEAARRNLPRRWARRRRTDCRGSPSRTKSLTDRETVKLKQALRGVKISTIYVGADEGGVPLNKLARELNKQSPCSTAARSPTSTTVLSLSRPTPSEFRRAWIRTRRARSAAGSNTKRGRASALPLLYTASFTGISHQHRAGNLVVKPALITVPDKHRDHQQNQQGAHHRAPPTDPATGDGYHAHPHDSVTNRTTDGSERTRSA